MAIHPDEFGQEWCVRLRVVPVLPEMFKGTLFYLK
jgi:hypothetical protein